MSRSRKPGRPKTKMLKKRGRKPIFTPGQKRILGKVIRQALKDQLRKLVKAI